MAAGRFREDLFYRLNVLRIHMPPLRERLEDVPELIEHLLLRLHQRTGLAVPRIETDALDVLRRYAWPGNVRELANVCERLAILHPGGAVGRAELAPVLSADTPQHAGAALAAAGAHAELPLHERLDAIERDILERALDDAAGSISEAARRLRTDRANLYRRMKRLGIER